MGEKEVDGESTEVVSGANTDANGNPEFPELPEVELDAVTEPVQWAMVVRGGASDGRVLYCQNESDARDAAERSLIMDGAERALIVHVVDEACRGVRWDSGGRVTG